MHFAPSIPCPYLAKVITKVIPIVRKIQPRDPKHQEILF